MNQLSWLLYFASVADNISITLAIVFFIVAAVAVASGVGVVACLADGADGGLVRAKCLAVLRKYSLIALVIMAVSTPIPSKETIYAIAVSEMGEKALATPLAGKATKALNAWLDRQIAGDVEKEDK